MGETQETSNFGDTLSTARRHYEDLRESLMEEVNDFADEHGISPHMLALLLVDLGVNSYVLGYLIKTDKPSSLGLKLELDRFNREIGDFIRSTKRSAEKFVAKGKDLLGPADAVDEAGAQNAA